MNDMNKRTFLSLASLQLHTQTLAERALAAAGRAGNQDNAHLLRRFVPAEYLLSYLDNLLFLQSLGHLDQVSRRRCRPGSRHRHCPVPLCGSSG